METCSYCERLLPAFLDGELDGPLRREVSSHLADCLVCMRESTAIEQAQELVRQTIEEKVDALDFCAFLDGVMGELDAAGPTAPSWKLRFQLWWASWRPWRSGRAPSWTRPIRWAGAAATVTLLMIGGVIFSQTETSQRETVSALPSKETAPTDPLAYAMGNQAQIESLTASTTVVLWNEPISNATVIWVGDTEGMP